MLTLINALAYSFSYISICVFYAPPPYTNLLKKRMIQNKKYSQLQNPKSNQNHIFKIPRAIFKRVLQSKESSLL